MILFIVIVVLVILDSLQERELVSVETLKEHLQEHKYDALIG